MSDTTTTVDNRRRIVLPDPATEGEVYKVEALGPGRFLAQRMTVERHARPNMSLDQFQRLVENCQTRMTMDWETLRQATREL